MAKMVTQIAEVVPEVSEKHTPDCAEAACGTGRFPGLLSKRHFSILDRVWLHFQYRFCMDFASSVIDALDLVWTNSGGLAFL